MIKVESRQDVTKETGVDIPANKKNIIEGKESQELVSIRRKNGNDDMVLAGRKNTERSLDDNFDEDALGDHRKNSLSSGATE